MFPRNEINVWCADLATQPDRWLPSAIETLSADERARHARYVRERDAQLFVLARATLRRILGRYAGLPPQMLSFEEGPARKPRLAPQHGVPLCFNVTHSGRLVLVAVTIGREVGIDVERIRPINDLEGLVRDTFSAAEHQGILLAPDPITAFFATWTRKEALIKALGRGLSFPLAAFDVEVCPTARPALLASRDAALVASDWTMHGLPHMAGYASALAVESADDSTVLYREWTCAEFDRRTVD